jgi:nucleotide-binding universal stress UspA family protein
MKKITTILVPTDFSEPAQKAFQYALHFADRYSAKIIALNVVYPILESQDIPLMVSQSTMYLLETAEEMMKTFIEAGIKQAGELKNPPAVRSEIIVGTPAGVITEIAEREGTDLIIMGTKGEHNPADEFFGSVSTATIRQAHCNVLVVPEEAAVGKITTVAYATDLQEADPYHVWETAKLLEPFHTIFRLVHVQTEPDESARMKMQDMEEFFKGHAPGLQITFHTISGKNVVEELNDFASTWDVNLLVMYSPRRNFLERLFHKSTTRQEALHGKVPLLVVKE